ncbi:MAG: transferrin receptor-like dimerization domain-containing protein, partial [Isosphaeraceae bacterium]
TAAVPPATFSPQLNPLGSGSDYTAFLDHLGIPAVDAGFTGRYGVYHSIFDDFFWMEKFGDPEFLTHATAARLYTAFLMRAAAAEILPLTFTPYGEALRDYVDDLRRIVERRMRARPAGSLTAESPFAESLANLARAVRAFQQEAAVIDQATRDLASRNQVDPEKLGALNDALQRVERAFLLEKGLPGRTWFKHAVYAPGLTTGYASWPLPGVRQAVIDNDARLLETQGPALIERINAATTALHRAVEAAHAAGAGANDKPESK